MAGRTVTVVLRHDYGHPDNNLSRQTVFETMAKMLPKVVGNARGKEAEDPVWFKHYDVVSITVD